MIISSNVEHDIHGQKTKKGWVKMLYAWVFTYFNDRWSHSNRIIVFTAEQDIEKAINLFNEKLLTHYTEDFIRGFSTNSDFVKPIEVKPGLTISDSDMA